MERAWAAKNRLLELGVPLESALYLLPNAKALRFHESGSLLYLAHKWVMRTCFNAQEEIYRASMDELEQVRAVHPRLARHMGPPCVLRARPHHAHLHRGRALLRRAGLAQLPERRKALVTMRFGTALLLAVPLLAAPGAGRVVVFLDKDLIEPFAIDFDEAGRAYVVEMGGNRVGGLDGGALRCWRGRARRARRRRRPGAEAQSSTARTTCWSGRMASFTSPTRGTTACGRIDLATRVVTRVAGTGEKGYGGRRRARGEAPFDGVFNIAFHGQRPLRLRPRQPAGARGGPDVGSGDHGRGQRRQGRARGRRRRGKRTTRRPAGGGGGFQGHLYVAERAGHALRVVDTRGRSARSPARARRAGRATAGRRATPASTAPSTCSSRRRATC